MNSPFLSKSIFTLQLFMLMCCSSFANVDLFRQARTLQHEGKYVEAIDAFKDYLLQPMDENSLDKQQLLTYSEALMQLMNTFQSKGEPEACVSTLEELYHASPILQKECLRDYCSIMGYALSRTEKMKEAEEMTLKVFTIPLNNATPERYFRDYAYAAAVFYSNPNYQKEVTDWCLEALEQARLCKNTSGRQWVTAMLGSIYKRNGQLSKALELFRQSKEEAEDRKDNLGVLNSLHMIVDLFLYWDVPEYADTYASEAIRVERSMTTKNPMVSAQTYINKGRAALQLGENDSVAFYVEKAREFCRSLPYNSGMVDIDLLHGIYLTERGGDSMHLGIQELQQVARQGTATNRTKAYYQLAQIYLQNKQNEIAEIMLDSMYSLIKQKETYIYAHLDYEPILNHYLKSNNRQKVEQYTEMMFEGQQVLREKRLNFNLVEAITDLQTEQQKQEIEIIRLRQTNQRLWFLVYATLSIVAILAAVLLLFRQKRQHRIQMKKAGEKLAALIQKLNQTNAEKEIISQEIDDIMNDRETRQELESLAPSVLQRNGESRFRQRFELLYPLFLPRLRERVPTVTRREELLSMLIVLKQDNKEIADLLAIAPRSVLMLRHRFRQKIGMDAEKSLENFIEEILEPKNGSSKANEE